MKNGFAKWFKSNCVLLVTFFAAILVVFAILVFSPLFPLTKVWKIPFSSDQEVASIIASLPVYPSEIIPTAKPIGTPLTPVAPKHAGNATAVKPVVVQPATDVTKVVGTPAETMPTQNTISAEQHSRLNNYLTGMNAIGAFLSAILLTVTLALSFLTIRDQKEKIDEDRGVAKETRKDSAERRFMDRAQQWVADIRALDPDGRVRSQYLENLSSLLRAKFNTDMLNGNERMLEWAFRTNHDPGTGEPDPNVFGKYLLEHFPAAVESMSANALSSAYADGAVDLLNWLNEYRDPELNESEQQAVRLAFYRRFFASSHSGELAVITVLILSRKGNIAGAQFISQMPLLETLARRINEPYQGDRTTAESSVKKNPITDLDRLRFCYRVLFRAVDYYRNSAATPSAS